MKRPTTPPPWRLLLSFFAPSGCNIRCAKIGKAMEGRWSIGKDGEERNVPVFRKKTTPSLLHRYPYHLSLPGEIYIV